MAAIITEEFRRLNARMVLDDIHGSNYYMGIGQQAEWPETIDNENLSAPYPKGTLGDIERAKHHLTGLFRVSTIHSQIVIPMNELLADVVYKPYDEFDPTCFYTDLTTGARPCYAMVYPNMIFLCIHKEEAADDTNPGMSDGDISSNFGLSGLQDYGTVSVSGYTWAFLGTYDNYSLVNSNEFISIGEEITPSSQLETETYAKGYFALNGDNNDILFTSEEPGNAGNFIQIEIAEDGALSQDSFNYTLTTGTLNQILFEFGPGSTASAFITFVNGLTNRLVTAEASGGSTGTMSAYPPTVLTGGASNFSMIKEKTGGAILGFNVIDGGKLYQAPDLTFEDDEVEVTDVPAVIYGIDEFGGSKASVDILVDVILDTTSLAGDWDVSANCGSIKKVLLKGNIPSGTTMLKGYSEARIELGWTTALSYTNNTTPSREASILVKLAPSEGFGRRKLSTLPAWYVGVYADTAKATYTPDETEFHQITLLKDPSNADGQPMTNDYVQPLDYFELDTWILDTELTAGWQILQNNDPVGVVSHIQKVEDNTSNIALFTPRFYYYKNYKHGFKRLDSTGNISFKSPDGQTTLSPGVPPTYFSVRGKELQGQETLNEGYSMHTGRIVFEDNRAGISRAEGQNEELKLVIQL